MEKNDKTINCLFNIEIVSMIKHYLILLDEQNNDSKESIFSSANKVNVFII
jgi:hypothetical protein